MTGKYSCIAWESTRETSTGTVGDRQWAMNGDAEYIWIPTAEAQKYRRAAEQARLRNARYNKTRPDRSNGKIPLAERPFIAWDGEGPQDTGYSLLGNSLGDEICYPTLKTRDCLDLLLESSLDNRQAVHVSFGFNYDVSNILHELPWRNFAALHKYGRTVFEDYKIEHIPRKWFRVSRGGVTVKIFDIFSFFNSSLTGALETWKIGPFTSDTSFTSSPVTIQQVPSADALSKMPESEVVRLFKSLRSEFLWKDIESIRLYMRLELKYTVQLMEKLRTAFLDAGYSLTSWHGPAALSRVAMKRHGVMRIIPAQTPADVKIAARYAFFGGHVEPFFAGLVGGPVFVADINSAYPYYATQLPNLSAGHWVHVKDYVPGKFAVWRIKYQAKPDAFRPYPLPYRDKHLNILFPHRVSGWYWSPEAALVADDPDATISEGWVFEENDPADRPFAWLAEYYRRRRLLKSLGNPAEYTFKLIINSVYGCLAQRTGWDTNKKHAPATHQLEYAGYITSGCRAAVYQVASQLGSDLVSIDTDGVTSLRPFDMLEPSNELGGWELSEYEDGLFWQSGIYCLKENGQWVKNKMRGIPLGSYTATDLLECMFTQEPLRLIRKTFTGYGLALITNRSDLNKWKEEKHEYVFGGTGKRTHITRNGHCTKVCSGNHHRLGLPAFYMLPGQNDESHPHKLPWLEWDDQKQYLADWTLYGEEEWYQEQQDMTASI